MNPPMRLRVVVLPQPDGPSRQKNSPVDDLQRDVVQGGRLAVALGR